MAFSLRNFYPKQGDFAFGLQRVDDATPACPVKASQNNSTQLRPFETNSGINYSAFQLSVQEKNS
jgi:hypothetical protein